jgi:predicted DNA-binding transcriptional regulator YafY
MKASRLLTLLLLLQSRGRATTAELAQRLEVSRRTVLRDVEALSASGVPVYAERGRHGGIVLLPGARLNASHLDPGEIEALSMTGLDHSQLGRLGLADASERAANKLAARRGQRSTGSADAPLSELIVAESSAWMTTSDDTVNVADLVLDLRNKPRLRISYRQSGVNRAGEIVVDPYGIAAKSNRWYLVADHDQTPHLFSLERLESYELLDQPAVWRPGQTLGTVWADLKGRVEDTGDLVVKARLRRSRIDIARRVIGTRLHDVRTLDDQWCEVAIRYPDLESVRQLLQFGDHIEVLAPQQARQRVHDLASDLVQRHASRTGDGFS